MEELAGIFGQITELGLENTLKRFYGIYRAEVVDNKDPEKRGRVRLKLYELGQELASDTWVLPLFQMAGSNRGCFLPPEEGDHVRVFFHFGEPNSPVGYLGGWYSDSDKPSEFDYTNKRPEKRGFVTRGGHSILISDEPGNEYIRVTWHKMSESDPAKTDAKKSADRSTGEFSVFELNRDGGVVIANKKGSLINLDPVQGIVHIVSEQGHSFSMDADGFKLVTKQGEFLTLENGGAANLVAKQLNVSVDSITFRAGGVNIGDSGLEPLVLGNKLLQWLATHTHGTGVGPSSPPLDPPKPDMLSTSNKTK